MRAVKQVAAFFAVLVIVLALTLGLWLTSDTVTGWQTWLFRAAHQVTVVADGGGSTRTVTFALCARKMRLA